VQNGNFGNEVEFCAGTQPGTSSAVSRNRHQWVARRMENEMRWIAALCVVGAIVVMISGHDGWGWLLFIAFIALTS